MDDKKKAEFNNIDFRMYRRIFRGLQQLINQAEKDMTKPQPKTKRQIKTVIFSTWSRMRLYVRDLMIISQKVQKNEYVDKMTLIKARTKFWSFLFHYNDVNLYYDHLDFLRRDFERLFN